MSASAAEHLSARFFSIEFYAAAWASTKELANEILSRDLSGCLLQCRVPLAILRSLEENRN